MKKNNILIILTMILVILLIFIILIHLHTIKIKKSNLEDSLKVSKKIIETNESYIPQELEASESNYSSEAKSNVNPLNQSPENVSITVIADSITKEKANILIIDNNLNKYSWEESFRLQKKINGNWEEMTPINDLIFTSLAHNVNEKNELIMEIDYKKYYGQLETGIYRIVKNIYDNTYIDLYSNEFEIK